MLLRFGTTRGLRSTPDAEPSIPLPSGNLIQSVINAHDGETVAIGGAETRTREDGKAEVERRLVYFVTAHIIKRAE
jgi:hypothetical protein